MSILRPLDEDDLLRTYTWMQSDALYEHLVGTRRMVSWEEAREWMREHWLGHAHDRRYALCVPPTNTHIGNVYLLRSANEREFEFHVVIGDPNSGQGWGQAPKEALAVAFELGRWRSGCKCWNQPVARGIYERGFEPVLTNGHRYRSVGP